MRSFLVRWLGWVAPETGRPEEEPTPWRAMPLDNSTATQGARKPDNSTRPAGRVVYAYTLPPGPPPGLPGARVKTAGRSGARPRTAGLENRPIVFQGVGGG